MSFLKNFLIEEEGQDMVEYGLVIALVVVVAGAAFTTFGTSLFGKLQTAFNAVVGLFT